MRIVAGLSGDPLSIAGTTGWAILVLPWAAPDFGTYRFIESAKTSVTQVTEIPS